MAPNNDPRPGESLGARIKRLREALDLTQVELASSIGVAVQTNGPSATARTIIDWEADRSVPSPRMRRVLAGRFEVSLEYLMTGKGSGEPVAPATTRERLLDIETQLGDHAQRLTHLEAPDRRQGNRPFEPDNKTVTEVQELRAALQTLRTLVDEQASDLREVRRQLREAGAERGTGTGADRQPDQP